MVVIMIVVVVRHAPDLGASARLRKSARDRRGACCDHREKTKEAAMDGPHLIYFSDPMCSWCYGFSPVIEAVRRAYGDALPIRLVMGGLRPGTEKAMTPEAAREIAGHWTHVHEASGL